MGQPARALRLAGAGAVQGDAATFRLPPCEQAVLEQSIATARAALDETTATAAWAVGQAPALEQAVAEALAGGPGG